MCNYRIWYSFIRIICAEKLAGVFRNCQWLIVFFWNNTRITANYRKTSVCGWRWHSSQAVQLRLIPLILLRLRASAPAKEIAEISGDEHTLMSQRVKYDSDVLVPFGCRSECIWLENPLDKLWADNCAMTSCRRGGCQKVTAVTFRGAGNNPKAEVCLCFVELKNNQETNCPKIPGK